MLIVEELMVNLCDFKGTVYEENFETIWNDFVIKAQSVGKKKVDGAYFGFEFCANMLVNCKIDKIIEAIHFVKRKGLFVTWVLPPLHERYLEIYKLFMTQLFAKAEIDECVVNDIGTLIMLREELGFKKKILLGRMFDKSVREIRFDVSEYPQIVENENIFFKPGVYSEMMRQVAGEYQVERFETDTLPNGVLQTECWGEGWNVTVHYPRIVLSRPAYCEYDAVNKERKEKFLFRTHCNGECRIYEKTIKAENRPDIKKSGLAVTGCQRKPVEEVVTGKIRMVYSEG